MGGFICDAAESAARSTQTPDRPADDPRRRLMDALDEVTSLLRSLSAALAETGTKDDSPTRLREAAQHTYRVMDRAMAGAL
ncbi:hypothetical protein ACFVH7_12290 [Kitasatospora indigofera]|uniref:hypothetical protein n=1 Tax=Kitasatospora indigofera TaxID=67307 RepID=UPI003624CFAC